MWKQPIYPLLTPITDIMEDPFLKNRTIDYMQAYRSVVTTSSRFRVSATELYKQIDTVLGLKDSKLPESLKLHKSRTTLNHI